MGDHCIGRIEDGLGRAVILLQSDGAAATELLFEAEDVLNGGAAEPINALVVITHHADVLIAPRQHGGEQILHMVGILIFVHQYIAEFPLIVAKDLLILLEQLHRDKDNVIKIQRVVFLQLTLILLICPGNELRLDIPGTFRRLQHFLRGNHFVLLPADGAQDILGWEGLLIHVQLLENTLHHPLRVGGVVDGEAAGIAHSLNIPP